jgi:hypothetical protein
MGFTPALPLKKGAVGASDLICAYQICIEYVSLFVSFMHERIRRSQILVEEFVCLL